MSDFVKDANVSTNDLISRQAAIDLIHKTIYGFFDIVDNESEIRMSEKDKLLLEVNKAISNGTKELPSAERWIPVSKRLPKNDDWVIVTILDESGDTPWRYTDFGWYLEAANCWIVDAEQRTDVIAWMPLPEPYKEGE